MSPGDHQSVTNLHQPLSLTRVCSSIATRYNAITSALFVQFHLEEVDTDSQSNRDRIGSWNERSVRYLFALERERERERCFSQRFQSFRTPDLPTATQCSDCNLFSAAEYGWHVSDTIWYYTFAICLFGMYYLQHLWRS